MKQVNVKNIKESIIKRTFNDETLIMAFLFKWQNDIIKQDTDDIPIECIPMRLCALIESYVRLKYSEIINDDFSVLERLAKNNKNPIQLNALAELKKENVSLGSFIAYQFPCSSIDSIKDTFKLLLNKDLFEELCKDKIGKNAIGLLNQMYLKRHELAHEIAWDINIEKKEALSYIDATRFFIVYIKELIISY